MVVWQMVVRGHGGVADDGIGAMVWRRVGMGRTGAKSCMAVPSVTPTGRRREIASVTEETEYLVPITKKRDLAPITKYRIHAIDKPTAQGIDG